MQIKQYAYQFYAHLHVQTIQVINRTGFIYRGGECYMQTGYAHPSLTPGLASKNSCTLVFVIVVMGTKDIDPFGLWD